jgi:hypothetical protein
MWISVTKSVPAVNEDILKIKEKEQTQATQWQSDNVTHKKEILNEARHDKNSLKAEIEQVKRDKESKTYLKQL